MVAEWDDRFLKLRSGLEQLVQIVLQSFVVEFLPIQDSNSLFPYRLADDVFHNKLNVGGHLLCFVCLVQIIRRRTRVAALHGAD